MLYRYYVKKILNGNVSKTELAKDVTNLVTKQSSFTAEDLLKDVFTDVWVNSTQWIVQQVDVTVLIDGSRHWHSLLLTAAQINSLTKPTASSSSLLGLDNTPYLKKRANFFVLCLSNMKRLQYKLVDMSQNKHLRKMSI